MTKTEIQERVKRTKVITTIGPATHEKEKIAELYMNGMNTVRLNFSHGSYEEHGARIQAVKELRAEKGWPISIMLDTKGPEIRVGRFKNGAQQFKAGDKVVIFTDDKSYQEKEAVAPEMTVAYDMSQDLKAGDLILIDDGKLELTVDSVDKVGKKIHATAFNAHLVKTNKRVNLPGVDFSMPFLAEKDINDIKYGIEQKVDYIAASFVNSAENVQQIRGILKEGKQEDIQIISKIESQVGINNIDSIIKASDGIMIARGDLGLEIPYYDVPYWEKVIIRKCRAAGKIVIVATQMLESMTDNPSPTRAEVTDVYTAVELGADATMLSGESAAGKYPFITTATMATIDKRAEMEFYDKLYYKKQLADAQKTTKGQRANIANKLAEVAFNGKYRFAIVLSRSGQLLKTISKFRPNVTILGVSTHERLWTAYGCWSSIYMNIVPSLNTLNEATLTEIAKKWGAETGEKVLIVRNEDVRELTLK